LKNIRILNKLRADFAILKSRQLKWPDQKGGTLSHKKSRQGWIYFWNEFENKPFDYTMLDGFKKRQLSRKRAAEPGSDSLLNPVGPPVRSHA
jgi:hypothetical protein